jgi:hypothetical protein
MRTLPERLRNVERILAGGIDEEGNPHSGLVDAVQKLDNRVKLVGVLLGVLTLIPAAKALGIPTDHLLSLLIPAVRFAFSF